MSNALAITRTLPTFRLEALDGVIAKLSKKAAKLGVAAPTYKVTGTEVVDVSDDKRHPHMVEFSTVEIAYEVIRKAGDWTFLAKIEPADVVDGVPRNKVSGINLTDEHAKRFITTHMECEHCRHNRKRNATYMVQDCNDKTLQVGSSCLQEFLGVDPAAAVNGIEFAAAVAEIGDDEERWGCGGSAPRVWKLADAAEIAVSLISKNGFVAAAAAEYGNATKTGDDMVKFLIRNVPQLANWYEEVTPSEENKTLAATVVKRLSDRILPDYKNNPAALDQFAFKVGILLNKGWVGWKDMQILAASINREAGILARENVKSTIKNEWLPGVKEGDKVAVEASISMVKEVNSMYGSSLLVKFVTSDGYPLTTFHSGQQEFNLGTKVKVMGTVKKLEDGKFGKCVMLTRCKVVG